MKTYVIAMLFQRWENGSVVQALRLSTVKAKSMKSAYATMYKLCKQEKEIEGMDLTLRCGRNEADPYDKLGDLLYDKGEFIKKKK